MELDRIPLWRSDHVAVKQLAEDFARYVYLPRLKDSNVLVGAVRDGVFGELLVVIDRAVLVRGIPLHVLRDVALDEPDAERPLRGELRDLLDAPVAPRDEHDQQARDGEHSTRVRRLAREPSPDSGVDHDVHEHDERGEPGDPCQLVELLEVGRAILRVPERHPREAAEDPGPHPLDVLFRAIS